MNIGQIVGHNIRHFRCARKLTRSQLAQQAKISRSYIRRIEVGSREMTLSMLQTLAKTLEISPSILFKEPSLHTADCKGRSGFFECDCGLDLWKKKPSETTNVNTSPSSLP